MPPEDLNFTETHRPIRHSGPPVPPPRVILRGMFGTPPSLETFVAKRERVGAGDWVRA